MTKRAIIIATVILVLVVQAYMKDPAQGQNNLSNLLSWVWPF